MFLHYSTLHAVSSIWVNYFLSNHLLSYVYLIRHYLKMLSVTQTAASNCELGMINECWVSWTEFKLL